MLFILTAAVMVQAQTSQPKFTEDQKKALKAKMAAYKEKLNLTSEQEVKVKEINTEYIEALSKIKESNGSKISKVKKLKAAQNVKNEKMKSVLSNEQYNIYKQQQKEMKEAFKSGRAKS